MEFFKSPFIFASFPQETGGVVFWVKFIDCLNITIQARKLKGRLNFVLVILGWFFEKLELFAGSV